MPLSKIRVGIQVVKKNPKKQKIIKKYELVMKQYVNDNMYG